MADLVLVHGAWHGGWCWKRVAPSLRAGGHRVWTPTLTGLGERAHLAHEGVGLSTHIQDVSAFLEAEELEGVVLVGHSYGGAVITGVADQAPERIAKLVYLDAFVPQHGQSLLDLVGPEVAAGLQQVLSQGPRPGVPDPSFFGVFDPADVGWLNRRLTPQPMASFAEPLNAPAYRAGGLPRTYVYCDQPAMGPFEQFRRFEAEPGWTYHTLHTGHDAMVSDPEGVAAILLEEARRAA